MTYLDDYTTCWSFKSVRIHHLSWEPRDERVQCAWQAKTGGGLMGCDWHAWDAWDDWNGLYLPESISRCRGSYRGTWFKGRLGLCQGVAQNDRVSCRRSREASKQAKPCFVDWLKFRLGWGKRMRLLILEDNERDIPQASPTHDYFFMLKRYAGKEAIQTPLVSTGSKRKMGAKKIRCWKT